jgi:hypothetical protein
MHQPTALRVHPGTFPRASTPLELHFACTKRVRPGASPSVSHPLELGSWCTNRPPSGCLRSAPQRLPSTRASLRAHPED